MSTKMEKAEKAAEELADQASAQFLLELAKRVDALEELASVVKQQFAKVGWPTK